MRFNVRYMASAAFVLQLTALTILITTRDLTLIYIYSAIMGLSNGALFAALPTFIGAYYGRDRYARVLGVVFPFQVVSQAVAATAAGALYDATASYGPSFIIVIVISLIGLFSAYRARPPK
jgi:MFS family permease